MRSVDIDRARGFASGAGYAIYARDCGWAECLLVRDDERWFGRGGTTDEAVLDALHKAFPSHASRRLLNAAIDGLPPTAEPVTGAVQPANCAAASVSTVPEPPAKICELGESIDHAPAAGDVETPSAHPEPTAAVSVMEVPAPTTASCVGNLSTESEALAMHEPRRTSTSAVGELERLRDKVLADAEELGMCTPRRQRVVLTSWMATARSIQDEFPGDELVRDGVRRIARAISTISRCWWPGTIAALSQSRRPSDAAANIGADRDPCAQTWADVKAIADDVLAAIDADDTLKHRDDAGWADGRACLPAPLDPEELLERTIDEIESKAGGLFETQNGSGLPYDAELAHWVGVLRWLRPHVAGTRRWSAALGRCRQWVAQNPSEFTEARRWLQPDYHPDDSWARLLKLNTDEAQRREPMERSLLPPLPIAKGDASAAALSNWIVSALRDSGTDLDEIARMLMPHADAVLALDSDDVANGDRSVRRRMSKLKRKLADGPSVAPPVHTVESGKCEPSRAPKRDELHAKVVERTRGIHALLVTNRDDQELCDRLQEALGFASVQYVCAAQRRVDSAAAAVASGAYDIVLGATGFLSHAEDGVMSTACKNARVPYVRVWKGRPAACVRALARHFGFGVDADNDR